MSRPNILFFMTDQMQGQVLDADHPCLTPNMDRLIERGVRVERANPANPVCSPSRASLMTGLMPRNHGVRTVVHTVDEDQSCLRTEHPHWAQHLKSVGYQTGYFGKWHVERSCNLARFGWDVAACERTNLLSDYRKNAPGVTFLETGGPDPIEGFNCKHLWAVVDVPPEQRGMGYAASQGIDFINQAAGDDAPWCCFIATQEPHDPYVASQTYVDRYDIGAIPLSETLEDPMTGKPGLYRKARRAFHGMTERDHRMSRAIYYASITELDAQLGRMLDAVERLGELENTIVVVSSDHGDFLGAHGLYCKNVSAFEEAYDIPMVLAGPGIAQAGDVDARVGLIDVGPTLLELVDAEPLPSTDSRSFAPLLKEPGHEAANYQSGYAEYAGVRFEFGQRVLWDGPWKLVFNHFDYDELYNHDRDPLEKHNLVDDPACAGDYRRMMALLAARLRDCGDHSLLKASYPGLRGIATYGPGIADEVTEPAPPS